MFELLPESTGNSIGFRVSGKVSAEDYDVMLPKLDDAIEAHGRINLLVAIQKYGFVGALSLVLGHLGLLGLRVFGCK